MIFWGPPGIGKTTLANIIANESKRPFYTLSAINSGVKDVRDVIDKAKQSGGLFTTKNPILFIDEIHRLSPVVEEVLYPAMEDFQLDIMIAILMALDLTEHIDLFLPKQEISPLQQAKLQGKKRQRASGQRSNKDEEAPEW